MSRPRLDTDRLEAILGATASVVAARRADNVRLVDIADRAGVSVGTLQHYFGSRDELLAAAFQHANTAEATRCRELMQVSPEPLSALRAVLEGIMGTYDESLLWSEFWCAGARSSVMRGLTSAIYEQWTTLISTTIAGGVACGAFVADRPTDELGELLTNYADGLAVALLLDRIDLATAQERLAQMAGERLGIDHRRLVARSTSEQLV